MQNKLLSLLLFLAIFPGPIFADSKHNFLIGGLIRSGDFNLIDTAENIETNVGYNEEKLSNNIGELYIFNYLYDRYSIGFRWMRYNLEGSNEQIEQVLVLEYGFATFAVRFFQGNYLHPDIESRFGILLGKGYNNYNLTTRSNMALINQTIDEQHSSTGDAILTELFFESMVDLGLGYRLGYFLVYTDHTDFHNNIHTNGSSSENIYVTFIWQF